MSISTSVTRLLGKSMSSTRRHDSYNPRGLRSQGIKTPIIAAPMAYAGGGTLAAQVSLAGGFGFMGCGTLTVGAF